MNRSAVPPTYPPITIESEINRRLNYECVKNSTIRHAYLFGGGVNPNHPKLLAHQRKITSEVVGAGLTMIIHKNGSIFFAVKPSLPPEDMDFLKNVNLAVDIITPEENSRLGNLLGYPCVFNRQFTYKIDVVCTNIGPTSLFSFVCTLDDETREKIMVLETDIQESLQEFYPLPIIKIEIVKKGGKRKTRRKRK
jgi:hypothetical protein